MSQTKTIYEYLIKDGKYVKDIYTATETRSGNFTFRSSGKNGSRRFVNMTKDTYPKNHRICSLEDNEEKYRKILLEDCEKRAEKLREQLEKELSIMKILKEAEDV